MANFKNHFSVKLLTEYAIFLEDPDHRDYDESRLSEDQIMQIRGHIEACKQCHQQVDSACHEFQNLVKHVENSGFRNITTHGQKVKGFDKAKSLPVGNWRFSFSEPKIQIAIAVSILFLILLGSFYYLIPRHPYSRLASIKKPHIEFEVRGLESKLLLQAMVNYRKNNYEQALGLFQRFIEQKTSKEFHYFAHYYIGLSYLLLSQEQILGFIYDFDESQIQNGLNHLQEVIKLTQNRRYLEDVHWYRAKAYLMLKEYQLAFDELNKIIPFNGIRREHANLLIDELSKMEKK